MDDNGESLKFLEEDDVFLEEETGPVKEGATLLPDDQFLEPMAASGDGGQLAFIDFDEWWKAEWQGMPEFAQEDLAPWKSMNIHFASRADLLNFAELIGQRLTEATRAIWYPPAEIGRYANKRFVDES